MSRSVRESSQRRRVFITGGTGFIGRALAKTLIERGHEVRILVRPESTRPIPAGCTAVVGNPFFSPTYERQLSADQTFVHLLGVPNPSPRKAAEFRSIDLPGGLAAISAAKESKVGHFIYLSVAHPAPVMKAYIEVRKEVEAVLMQSGIKATILRPWYVVGPKRRWPLLLFPLYVMAERWGKTRDLARRLGLVTLTQIVSALVQAIESPPDGVRIIEVPDIRRAPAAT